MLIVATKATGLADALERVPAEAPALVVPLLNGSSTSTRCASGSEPNGWSQR